MNKLEVKLLIAEDDDDDFFLTERAIRKSGIGNEIERFGDGQALVEYLQKLKTKEHPTEHYFILLDLNMPRMDGREALRQIKSDDYLRRIPVVVFTTSESDEDVIKAYSLGTNSFIRKPAQQDDFLRVIGVLKQYWLEIVKLPDGL